MNQFDPFESSAQNAEGPELARRPPNRGLLIGGIVCAVIAVAVILAVVFGPMLRAKTAPAKTVQKAYNNTAEAMQRQMQDSPWQLWSDIAEALQKGTLKASFAFEDGWSEGSGDIWLRSNWKEPAFAVGVEIVADGMPMDGELYFDAERAVLSSSILPDSYGVTFETIREDFLASALPEWLELDEDDIDEIADAFEEISQQIGSLESEGLTETSKQIMEDFLDGLDFQASKESQTIGGEDCSCIVLTAQLTEQDVQALTDAILELYLAPSAAMEESLGYTGLEETSEMMEEMMTALYEGADLTCYVYHDRLVKLTLSNDADFYGETFHYSIAMDYGAKPGEGGWTFDFSLNPIGEEPLKLHLAFTPDEKGGMYSDRLTLDVTAEEEEIGSFALSTDWDKESGKLTMKLESLTEPSDSIVLEGNLKLNEDGRSVLRILNLGELVSEIDGGEVKFDLSFTAEKDTGPSCPVFINLDQWDEETLEEIMQAIYDYSESIE